MTACADLYKKWKIEPNFCGLGRNEAALVDKYISFVEEFSKEYNIPEDIVYRNAPRSAVKPILRFRRDSAVRVNATKAIASTLKGKHAVTSKFVIASMGINQTAPKFKEAPKVIIAPISEPHKEVISKNTIKDKIRLLTTALTVGQIDILREVMKFENLDNEYEAMALILKWASERINR